MNTPATNSQYEAHNMEIIKNNFPERMDVLIPCTCGKTFKAQDGHFLLFKNHKYKNMIGLKTYKGFYWDCREKIKQRDKKYDRENPDNRIKCKELRRKGNKNSFARTIRGAMLKHKKCFPNEPCIFKYGGRFKSSTTWKEASEHNKQIIKNFLEKQNYKCALTGDSINILTASIDRIDSNHGYIEGNIQLTTWDANSMKSNFQNDKFIAFCTKVYLHTQNKKSSSESSQDLNLQSICIPQSLESNETLEE